MLELKLASSHFMLLQVSPVSGLTWKLLWPLWQSLTKRQDLN